MNLPRILYITNPNEDFSDLSWVDRLYEGGVRWIQLRIKEEDLYQADPRLHYLHTFLEIADLLRDKTEGLGMLLSINDRPDVARFSRAEGLHFGMEDSVDVHDAADTPIIGGTVHSFEDLKNYSAHNLTYLGLGPFRNTSTKQLTKAVLGIGGLESFVQKMEENQVRLPVYAIGGIREEDCVGLLKVGVYGFAVSSLFHDAEFSVEIIRNFVNKVDHGKQ